MFDCASNTASPTACPSYLSEVIKLFGLRCIGPIHFRLMGLLDRLVPALIVILALGLHPQHTLWKLHLHSKEQMPSHIPSYVCKYQAYAACTHLKLLILELLDILELVYGEDFNVSVAILQLLGVLGIRKRITGELKPPSLILAGLQDYNQGVGPRQKKSNARGVGSTFA